MPRRPIQALHVCGDFAVRPRPELLVFADGSRLWLFDSFKPACGYTQFWFALGRDDAGSKWWVKREWQHVDSRDVLADAAGKVRFHADPQAKLAAMKALVLAAFASAGALLEAARPQAFVADRTNNDLAPLAPPAAAPSKQSKRPKQPAPPARASYPDDDDQPF